MFRKDRKEEYYTIRARKEGYPARSVYKLKSIDEEFRIFKKGDAVLDLGSAPGSWLLYISQAIGDKGKAVGIDIQDLKIELKPNIIFIKKSVFELEDKDFPFPEYDSIVADLSPNTCGIKLVDAGRSLELSEAVFEIVKKRLKKGGNFVCKIFQGEGSDQFLKEISLHFCKLKRVRPKAVIKNSKEFYIVGLGFKMQ